MTVDDDWMLVVFAPSEFFLSMNVFSDFKNELVEYNTTTERNDITLQKCEMQCDHDRRWKLLIRGTDHEALDGVLLTMLLLYSY